jgi:NADPH-dependent ferric siderophore reductase
MSVETASPATAAPPFVLTRAVVEAVDRVSPTFVRITFGAEAFADVGNPGHVLDQRIKLIFPNVSGGLPDLEGVGSDWYQAWLAVPEAERGSMRTYSIRELLVDDDRTRLVIDFVLHIAPGASGPASRWANAAVLGDELLILGPRRGRTDGGGIEYGPGDARTVLLAGDETAAPAIARILEDVGREVRGVAFIEVPEGGDILRIDAPDGVEVRWLPRHGKAHGEVLIPAVLDYLGDAPESVEIVDVETEDLLWETPVYSGLGEEVVATENHADRYFWIAGESGVVTTLRRHLVKDLGIDRTQVAFMGYWRHGVAMRG